MKNLIIALTLLLTIGLCGCYTEYDRMAREAIESFENAEEAPLEEGQSLIVLDQTAEFGVPKGYVVSDNSYYSKATELNEEGSYLNNICFERPEEGNSIRVSGWPSSDAEQIYTQMKEDAGTDPDIEIIRAPAGDAFFHYAGINDDDQPLELASYIRIGSNTYCIGMENYDDNRVLTKDEIAEYKEYVQSIDQFRMDEIAGKWKLYGCIEEGKEPNEENIVTGIEYRNNYGTEVPEQTITIDKRGIREIAAVPGTKAGELSKIKESTYIWETKVQELNGKKTDTPLKIKWLLHSKDDFLFVSETCSDKAYTSGNTQVYRRAK